MVNIYGLNPQADWIGRYTPFFDSSGPGLSQKILRPQILTR